MSRCFFIFKTIGETNLFFSISITLQLNIFKFFLYSLFYNETLTKSTNSSNHLLASYPNTRGKHETTGMLKLHDIPCGGKGKRAIWFP
jgi:hypothetical protein